MSTIRTEQTNQQEGSRIYQQVDCTAHVFPVNLSDLHTVPEAHEREAKKAREEKSFNVTAPYTWFSDSL